jgi:hypothetical protein
MKEQGTGAPGAPEMAASILSLDDEALAMRYPSGSAWRWFGEKNTSMER